MFGNTAKLDLLADRIRQSIDQRETGWVAATLDLCVALAEARAEFTADIEFGRWCDASGFKLSPHDRAAAVAMGKESDHARRVLETTERRSLQHIYTQEFRSVSNRYAHVSRPTVDTTKQTPAPKPVNEKRQRAFAAYDEIAADKGRKPTFAEVQQAAGVSNTVARAVFTTRAAEASVQAEAKPAPTDAELDAIEASLPPAIQEEIRRVVLRRRRKWEDETGITLYMKQIESMMTMFTTPSYAVMYRAEYNTIMRCLHPDTARSRSDAELAEGFRLFTYYKLKILNDEEERAEARRKLRANMPKTLADMIARKNKKTA